MFIRYNAIAKIWEYDSTSLVNDPDARVGDGKAPWLPLPIDYSQIYNPPIIPEPTPPYVLPATVAHKNVVNQFTLRQRISNADGDYPRITFTNTTGAVGEKVWELINFGNEFRIWSLNDAESVPQGHLIISKTGVNIGGTITERNRPVPLGEWQNVPFNPTDYIVPTGLWTINDLQASRYTLIGKTIIWTLNISSSNLSAAVDSLFVKLPGGFTSSPALNMGSSRGAWIVNNGTTLQGVLLSSIAQDNIRLYNTAGTFAAGTLGVYLTFTGEIL